MYAILQQGGHQYRVSAGDRLLVDRLDAEVGSMIALEPVLLLGGEAATTVGTPVVAGARVAALVVSHRQGKKLRVFKYKAKKRYRRTHGHRSHLTELRIEGVLTAGEALPGKPETAPAAARKPARGPRVAAAATVPEGSAAAPVATAAAAPRPRRTTTRAAKPAAAPEAAATPAPARPRRTTKRAPADSAGPEE